ncbi:protein GRAVITROPIC IN THE LIGHT 1 [Mercurialis annua]|uniref:protein GRAVITROPIC IN THE LIGHT 1 n=1 Tax=Mercurialis annua TaxID=3986 RepID=UPI00215F56DE|nr:protein GRAVITROPIC IN THE LIGHT 1 [Mercurialis annua]
MEYAIVKPSSNISEMVTKFAKLCKLRSIGVFSNENPNQQCNSLRDNNVASVSEDSSDATVEIECDTEKIGTYPPVVLTMRDIDIEGDYIIQLFDAVSELKLAYIQLQEAHVPYNADKIIAADEQIVFKLEALCKIKRTYKEKRFSNVNLESSHFSLLDTESLLEKLKTQSRAQDDEIVRLRQELHNFLLGNTVLAEKIRQKSLEIKNVRVLNISLFENMFREASKSIHDFAKPVISLMKASGWDLDMAANSIESGVVYFKRQHKKYAFEAYVARRMFHGISLKSYNVDDVMRFDDPIDYLIENPNSEFSTFCGNKYLFAVHPVMEMSFFGNLDQRLFILSGKHPRTPFYQIFARMAKWIWALQGIARSVDPKAEIYVVNRGSKFSDVFMEPIEADILNGGQADPRVEFMVMPGFRLADSLMRSRVYLSC